MAVSEQAEQTAPLKAWAPEEIDHVIQKARVFSNPGRNLDNWTLISGIYSEDSKTVDPFGKLFSGLDGIKEAWAAWAPRQRYTHGWSEYVLMLTEDIAIKFYRYPNCGEDDDGEPWDFMCEGFYVLNKTDEGSWIVLLDCPFCRTREWIGKPEMTAPWDALLEPVSGDKRVTEGDYVTPMEAGRREPGPPEDCGLCQSLDAHKHGDRNGSAAKVTCRPGYVVPMRPRLVPSPVFHEDDLCWIAECELCAVPMVISKKHNEIPSEEEGKAMESKLREVVDANYGYEPWIDPANLRIPDHYHAHARPLGRLMAHALNRPAVPID